jgi:hypothetical protein
MAGIIVVAVVTVLVIVNSPRCQSTWEYFVNSIGAPIKIVYSTVQILSQVRLAPWFSNSDLRFLDFLTIRVVLGAVPYLDGKRDSGRAIRLLQCL